MEQKSWINLINLKKCFFLDGNEPLLVLNDISCTFIQGERYAIKGVSGSGKSTLLFLLLGFDIPTSGSILYNGNDLAHYSLAQRQALLNYYFGFVLQKPYLIKELTVLENVMLKGFAHTITKQDQEMALELLAAVGLSDKAHTPPATLSGGQQQRVALARALFRKPTFLIADEPTAHLDAASKQQVLNLMLTLSKTYTMGLIISTHDHEIARHMNITFILDEGKMISSAHDDDTMVQREQQVLAR